MPELKPPTLLPCPFCAGTDLALPDEEHRYYVRCLNIECLADGPYCDSSEEAFAAWNTRTIPSADMPIEQVRAELAAMGIDTTEGIRRVLAVVRAHTQPKEGPDPCPPETLAAFQALTPEQRQRLLAMVAAAPPGPPTPPSGPGKCPLCGKPVADHPKDMTCPPKD